MTFEQWYETVEEKINKMSFNVLNDKIIFKHIAYMAWEAKEKETSQKFNHEVYAIKDGKFTA